MLRRDASINFKAKGNNLVSVLACNLLMAAYEEDENWPEIFVKVSVQPNFSRDLFFICGLLKQLDSIINDDPGLFGASKLKAGVVVIATGLQTHSRAVYII